MQLLEEAMQSIFKQFYEKVELMVKEICDINHILPSECYLENKKDGYTHLMYMDQKSHLASTVLKWRPPYFNTSGPEFIRPEYIFIWKFEPGEIL